MTFALIDVAEWHTNVACVPTAIGAITGLALDSVMRALVKAAAAHRRVAIADPAADFNIQDWLRVIRDLGGSWAEIEDYHQLDYGMRQTISDYIARPTTSTLRLVFGENDVCSMTHVFAMGGTLLVDTYTNGKMVAADPSKVPPSHDVFRVKRVFAVSRP